MKEPVTAMYSCPYCGREFEVETYQSINAEEEDLRDRCVSGDLFRVSCPHCKKEYMIQYPFVYLDRKHKFVLWISDREVPASVRSISDPLHLQGYRFRRVPALKELPEYQDVDKAQRVLASFDEDALSNLPAVMMNENGTKVLVGPENVADELKDSSVVMTKFDIGDGMQGMIGVVGPTRMDYAQITARLSYFAESLSKAFAKPEAPQLPEAVSDENHKEA